MPTHDGPTNDDKKAFLALLNEQDVADINTVLTKDKNPIVNLCRNMVVVGRLQKLANAELGVLLMDHVYSKMNIIDPRSSLVSEVIDRLGYVGPPEPKPEG